MRVFIDSSGFLALMDRSDHFHPAARDIATQLDAIRAQHYTSNFIVDEACTLVRARTSHGDAAKFLRSLKPQASCVSRRQLRLRLSAFSSATMTRISALQTAHHSP